MSKYKAKIKAEAGVQFTNETASRVLVLDASGNVVSSTVTSAELANVSGLTSAAVSINGVQTLTNKTLTSPVVNSPTGIVKADVGLSNVDNTSDATKNSAAVTLTNKTITSPLGLVKADVGLSNVDNTSDADKPVSTAQSTAIGLKINSTEKGAALGVATLDSDGLIPITQIPPAAIERLVIVADQTARFALTLATVQNGDTVKQTDTGTMYFVFDDTNLNNSSGYRVYTAATASSVPWSGVTGTPTTLAGYGIPDNFITALTGEVTANGPGSVGATVSNSAVINKVLTGYVKGAGTVSATDTILGSIQKLDANIPTLIDNLSDVTITSPILNDRLTWNGAEWVNSPVTVAGVGSGISLFPDDNIVVDSYGGMPTIPIIGAATTNSIVVPSGTTVFGRGYLYNTDLLNTVISGGAWEFHFYCKTNNATGTSQLGFDTFKASIMAGTLTVTGTGTTRTLTATNSVFVGGDANADQRLSSYVQTAGGTFQVSAFTSGTVVDIITDSGYVNETNVTFTKHSLLFGTDSADINSTTTIILETKVTEPTFNILPTDKLALRVYGIASGTRTINFYVNGTTTYSHIVTPLTQSHNDLAGLQGGNTTERYHLSAAQSTLATQLATTSQTGLLSSTDWNTFNNKVSVVSGDISPTSFSAANNQSTVADVTGLAFAAGAIRSFKALVSVSIDATTDLNEVFELLGVQLASGFVMSVTSEGEDSGVVFSITSAGQVQYTSTNVTGFVTDTIKFRAITTSV